MPTPLKQFYSTLIRENLRDARDEEELLFWMLLIHTHKIHLRAAVIEDFPGKLVVPSATQRYAADVLSDLWPEPDQRRSANYWYRRFQTQFGDPKKAVLTHKAQLDDLVTRLQATEQVATVQQDIAL